VTTKYSIVNGDGDDSDGFHSKSYFNQQKHIIHFAIFFNLNVVSC